LHELGGLFTTSEKAWDKNTVPANQLALIVVCLLQKKITGRTAKQLLAMKFEGDRRDVNEIIDQDMLMLVPMAKEDYVTLALGLIDQNDHVVRQIRDKGRKDPMVCGADDEER
jgi:aspartyl-tRNA(Asn)/glutamyl-tRNA(Gln) amidotransferase subunit B